MANTNTNTVPLKRKLSEITSDANDDHSDEPVTKKAKQDQNPQDSAQKFHKNESTLENIHESVAEEIELPPEILVQIFSLLPIKNIPSISLVSRHWWLCSKDETLSWIPLETAVLEENGDSYYFNTPGIIKLRKPGSYSSVMAARATNFGELRCGIVPVKIEHIKDATPKWSHGGTFYYWLKDANDKTFGAAKRKGYDNDFSNRVPEFPQDYYSYHIKSASFHEGRYLEHTIVTRVNARKVEKLVRAGNPKPDAVNGFVKKCCRILQKMFPGTESNYLDDLFNPDEAYLPVVLPILNQQPEQIIGVKMHSYQINAINWMVTVEQDNEKKYDVSPLIKIPQTEMWLKFGEQDASLVLNENIDDHNLVFNPKGGVLADEMGLGKTLEVVGLIVSNPPKELPVNARFFSTKATIVACPNHLVQQWTAELDKHVTPKMNIVPLTTINQIKKTTYQQIIDADIVIVSYNLLKNKNYLAYPDSAGLGLKGEAEPLKKRHSRVMKVLDGYKGKSPADLKGPILEHFHWHRVVLDEAHEVVDTPAMEMIVKFQRTYNWYISGTPFPSYTSLESARNFLKIAPAKKTKSYSCEHNFRFSMCASDLYVASILDEMLVQELLWRNTKASIASEYKMVDTKQELILLEFTPLESEIYKYLETDKRHQDILLKFCCQLHINGIPGETLPELQESMIELKANEISVIDKKIQDTIQCYEEAVEDLKARKKIDQWRVKWAESRVESYDTDMARLKAARVAREKARQKFKSLDSKGFKIKEIEKVGTKLANLIVYLRNLFKKDSTARVIIFSKNDNMDQINHLLLLCTNSINANDIDDQSSNYLEAIDTKLNENKISSAFAEGNIYMKTKAIAKFKDEDCKVILLNLNTAASGTNLIEASHVILMDPMTGSKEEALAYESQAVGRAQRQGQTREVTVVKFIIKNTIEHQLYLRNNAKATLHRTPSKLARSGSVGALTLSQSQ